MDISNQIFLFKFRDYGNFRQCMATKFSYCHISLNIIVDVVIVIKVKNNVAKIDVVLIL